MQEIKEFSLKVPDEKLERDIAKYVNLAKELGASDAKKIGTGMVILDERVRARCYSPRCPDYGTNLNCPPHFDWDLEKSREIISKYKYAVFIMLEVPPEEQTGADYLNPKHKVPGALKMYEIVAKIQSEAFYDGYPLALGFAGGPSCKRVFCSAAECKGIKGEGCRMALKSNPTMHSAGMNAYSMASEVGWKIYPIGKKTEPSQIPHGLELGLVLIH
jgi:predicted metal-binding protein